MPKRVKKDEIVEITTERMSFGIDAVGRLNGVVVFVAGAAPQEKVKVKLTSFHKSYWKADLIEVIEPSSDRVQPRCSVFGFGDNHCGGCQWQHLSYAAQVREKENYLVRVVSRALQKTDPEVRELLQTHPSKEEWNYRSRAQLRGSKEGLGFFARASHRIVNTPRCEVIRPELQKKWNSLSEKKKNLPEKVEWTLSNSGEVLEAINQPHAAHGFNQINQAQNLVLREIVKKNAMITKEKELLLDLYSGDGNLSEELVGTFKRIICVESQTPKTLPAQREFVEVKVENYFRKKGTHEKSDCILADPPRSGLEKAVEGILNAGASRLILVSCDPNTLARDLKELSKNYTLKELHFIDMFPQTHHIESIAILA